MKKTRKSVFETNSSSTHSICISLEDEILEYPKEKIKLRYGEYGWESVFLETPEDRLSYLLTALRNFMDLSEIDESSISKLLNWMDEENIHYDSSEIDVEGNSSILESGYIDHVSGTKDFVLFVLSNKDHFLKFAFSSLSFIQTGNDNSELELVYEGDILYKHNMFYKGN